MARLFFAAWPTQEIQQALGKLAHGLERECGGRSLPARNIHLTLVFLGDVARDRLPRLEAMAAPISTPPFDLSVNHVDYWRHNRIVWAGVERCPQALQLLVSRLEQSLAAEGFRLDGRPYLPHITLLRDARRAPSVAAMRAVAWPVRRYALVESVKRE